MLVCFFFDWNEKMSLKLSIQWHFAPGQLATLRLIMCLFNNKFWQKQGKKNQQKTACLFKFPLIFNLLSHGREIIISLVGVNYNFARLTNLPLQIALSLHYTLAMCFVFFFFFVDERKSIPWNRLWFENLSLSFFLIPFGYVQPYFHQINWSSGLNYTEYPKYEVIIAQRSDCCHSVCLIPFF